MLSVHSAFGIGSLHLNSDDESNTLEIVMQVTNAAAAAAVRVKHYIQFCIKC